METETATDRHTAEILEATVDLRRHLRQSVGPIYKFQAGPDLFKGHKIGACVFPPDEQKPYWTICTVGMSSIEMVAAPSGARFAELLISLPEDWDWSDSKNAWPINLLWTMAELIANNRNAAFIAGEQIRTKNSTIPIFANANRPAGGVWFRNPSLLTEKAWLLKGEEKTVRWLGVVPLFVEEFDFIEKRGENEFLDHLDENIVFELFDRRRRNAMTVVGESSEVASNLVPFVRDICARVGTALHWVSATRESTKRMVSFDVSLIAGFVASKQPEHKLNRAQCSVLREVFDQPDFAHEMDVEASLSQYMRNHAATWKSKRPHLPSARLNLFRKCDITFKTEFAQIYYSFLMKITDEFIRLSEGLSDEEKSECSDEINLSLEQHARGISEECEDDVACITLAHSINSKIAELSLAGLFHVGLSSNFEWLDLRELAIEYVLQSFVREIVLLNENLSDERTKFIATLGPSLGISGDFPGRENQIATICDDDGYSISEIPLPPWVELIAFANQLGEPKFQTVALQLLSELGESVLGVAKSLNETEQNWRETVLEALVEARLKSEARDKQNPD